MNPMQSFRRRRATTAVSLAISALICQSTRAVADTATWDNTTSSWSISGHWAHSDPGAIGLVPNNGNGGFTYNVVINGGNTTQDIVAGVTIDGLTLGGGNIDGGNQLTINVFGNWTAGAMSGAGTTTFGGTSTLSLSGASDKTLSRNVISNGAATWTAGRMDVSGGTLTNNNLFDAQADNSFENFGGVNAFNNVGTFTRTVGTGQANFNIPFSNSGTVLVSSGTLSLNGGGSSSGTFSAMLGSTLRFGGLTHTMTAARVNGTGTAQFSGGTVSFDAACIYGVTGFTTIDAGNAIFGNSATTTGLNMTGGGIGGAGSFGVTSVATWSAGTMFGAGTTAFTNTSTLAISTTSDKGLSRNVFNGGAVTWTGGRMDVSGGTFTNNNLFDAQADNAFENFGGTNAFNNVGTFTRTVGTGQANFNIPFNNTGTASVSSGTLSLNAGGGSTGTFLAAADSALRFGGGAQVMTGAQVSGAGTVEFSGGTTSFNAGSVYALTGFTTIDGGNASFGNSATTAGLNLSGGSIIGEGSLGITGVGTWTAGTMADIGTTVFTNTSALSISGASDKGLSRNVTSNGAATWTAGRMDVAGGTFTNNNLFDAQANNTFETFGGTNAFNNNGSFTRTFGTGTAGFNIPFNNAGTVSVSTATLSLNGGGASTGTFSAGPGSALRFGGGNETMTGARVSGAGIIEFSAGTTTFDAGSTYAVSGTTVIDGGNAGFGNSASTAGFNLSSGAVIGGGSLAVSGVATWSGGTMGDTGTTTFTNTSALSILGAADKGLSRNVVGNGVATWTAGRMNVASGTFTNNNLFDAQANNVFENFGGTNAFNNNGTFTRTAGTGAASFNIPFNNTGTVIVSSSTLSLNAGGSSSGTFSAATGSVLRFGGGNQVMTGARVNGAGTVEFAGGTTNFNATSVYGVSGFTTIDGGNASFGNSATTAGLNFSSGGILGAGSLGVSGVATWTGGGMADVGTTTFTGTSALTISGAADKSLSRNIVNNGTATWTAGRMNVSSGTVINNNQFDAEANNTFENFGGTNAFNNNGSFTRTVGTGLCTFNVPFNNAGTVSVSSGTLALNAGGSSTGTFSADAGSALRFSGGIQVITAARVGGAGTVEFSGGTTSFDVVSVYAAPGSTTIDGGNASFGNSAGISALNFSSGALLGSGSVGVSGIASWTGGGMAGTGTTAFTNTAALTISGPADKGLSRNVVSSGSATWTAGRMNVSSGTFTNNNLFDAEADNTFENFGGTNAFNNNGGFTRTIGVGQANFNIPFNNAGTVTASSGILALNAGGSSSGTFVASPGATLRIGGGQTLSGTSSVSGDGTLEVGSAVNTFGGSFNVATTHVLAGGTLRLAAGTNRVLRTQNLLIDGGTNAWSGRVDLTDGDAIIDYTGAGNSPINTVRNQIKTGFAFGGWGGNGIATSLGNTTHGLGYVEASQKFSSFPATFSGQTVDNTAVLVKYTYRGDADMDGDADGVDIGTWAVNFTGELGGAGTSVWTQGDWDYDGDVDGVDAGLWAQAFTGELGGNGLGEVVVNSPMSPGATAILRGLGITVVPEPASILLAAGFLGALRLRCRKS